MRDENHRLRYQWQINNWYIDRDRLPFGTFKHHGRLVLQHNLVNVLIHKAQKLTQIWERDWRPEFEKWKNLNFVFNQFSFIYLRSIFRRRNVRVLCRLRVC